MADEVSADMHTPIPEELRPWSVSWPGYAPVDITPPELQPAGIAASADWAEQVTDPTGLDWRDRRQHALVPFEVFAGRPRNPSGRTGRIGRDLGKWGENRAADAIVVADGPDGPQVLLIERSDNGLWALPGGMVELGERARFAAVRELYEETGVDLLARDGRTVYRGYVADHRATDEAWVCTTAVLFRLPQVVPAWGGDDALAARWWRLDSVEGLQQALAQYGAGLIGGHVALLNTALDLVGGGY